MTRSTRYFLVGSAFIVFLGLGTGLVATYSGDLPLGLSTRDDAQLGYMPADAAAVGYADVRAIMTSEFRQKVRQAMPSGEELAKFKTELGVDVEHDIDSVAAAYLGGGADGKGKSGVVVVRGRFNDIQIEALATQHGGVASEYQGKKILSMTPRESGVEVAGSHPAAAVAFLEPGVLALGELSAVKRAIDAGASGVAIKANTGLMKMVDEVRGGGNAWFVGSLGAMTDHAELPTELTNHLSAINMVGMSVHVNGGVRGALRAEARDDQSAEQLRDVVKGALAAGQLMAGQDPKIGAMLNSLQITGSGKTVGINFTVPMELIDMLNGIAAAHQLGTGTGIHK